VRQLSSKEKQDEETLIDKKIEDIMKRIENVEKDVSKNGTTLDKINKTLNELMKSLEKHNKSNSQKTGRLRKDVLDQTDQLEKKLGQTVELLKSQFTEVCSDNEDTQNQITLIKEETSQELGKFKADLFAQIDGVKNKTGTQLDEMISMTEHLSTVFEEHTIGYGKDKTELTTNLVALDNKISKEVDNLNNSMLNRFKTTEDTVLENLRQMIIESTEGREKIFENLQSANQNIENMRETYTAEFSSQLDEFEKTYTILSELVADFNKAQENQLESGKKISEIYDTIHWKFETLRDELSSRFEVLEGRVNESLDQLIKGFDTVSRDSEESLTTLHTTIDSLKIAYVDRLTKNLEALSFDIENTKKAIISAIPSQSASLDSSTLVGVKKMLEDSSKDLGDKLRTLKEEQVSLVNIQANLVSTLREYRTMLQELRITLLDKMEEFEKMMIR
jgi:DNA repair exonuclease SbcCD ATPase subunit